MSKVRLEVTEEEVYLNLVQTYDRSARTVSDFFKQEGISAVQYNVLRILRGAGGEGLPILTIADRLLTREPDITRLVDRLERGSFVKRRRSEIDRRVVLVSLSPKGLAVADKLEKPLKMIHREQFGHLSPAELTELNRLLLKAREKME